jgi:hypothetical protein
MCRQLSDNPSRGPRTCCPRYAQRTVAADHGERVTARKAPQLQASSYHTRSGRLPSDQPQVISAEHPCGQGPLGQMVQGVIPNEVGDSRRGKPGSQMPDPLHQGGAWPAEDDRHVGIAFRVGS